MKTPLALAFLLGIGLFACTPPEEDVHPKRRSARADNVARYMQKAQEFRVLSQSRAKPLVQDGLLPDKALKALLPPTQDTRLSALIFAQKNALESALREHFAHQAADETSALLTQFRDEAVKAVLNAPTPQDAAAKLEEMNAAYSQKLASFAAQQKTLSWTAPDAEQRSQSTQALQQAAQAMLSEISRDYGDLCAQKAEPVLQKAAGDYALALSSGNDRDGLQRELARVGTQADGAFTAVVAKYGDPVVSLSDKQAASLRAQLIAAHQEVEKQVEKLYGKEAVLQTRDIFETYKQAADALVRTPARLSQMQEALFQAGEKYRQEMTALQVLLNEELEINAAKVRGTPLSLAAK